MAYQFQNTLFPNSKEFHAEIADKWLGPGDRSSTEAERRAALAAESDESLALDAFIAWELDDNTDADLVELADAFTDLRKATLN
jgi:hypothetical protein